MKTGAWARGVSAVTEKFRRPNSVNCLWFFACFVFNDFTIIGLHTYPYYFNIFFIMLFQKYDLKYRIGEKLLTKIGYVSPLRRNSKNVLKI